jgi:hypothetical protein
MVNQMHDGDYEAMMCKGRITSLPIPQPVQTVGMCEKKPLVERKRGPYKRNERKAKETDEINKTYFKW